MILIVSSMFFGVVNFLRALSKTDEEFSWAPLVASVGRDDFERRLELVSDLTEDRIKIQPIYLRAPNNDFKNLLNPRVAMSGLADIFRTLCTLRPKAVVVFFVLDAYPLALLKRLLGYRLLIVAVGGDINRHQHQIHVLARRMIYSQSDMILAVSNDLGSKIRNESSRSAIILPTGVDPSYFTMTGSRDSLRRKWSLPQNEFIILTVSNLEAHKGVDVAIRALSLALQRAPELRLIIVGTGPQRFDLDKLVADLDLDGKVSFLGEFGRQEMRELYSASDLFILSSSNEGLPFALLEAMSCECISLASPVGDIPLAIRDGQNGFIVNRIGPAEFAEKINQIRLMRKETADSIRENGRCTIIERFNLTTSATRIVDAVRQCTAGKRAS